MKKINWDKVEKECEEFSKNNLNFFIDLNVTIGELTELIYKFNIKPKRYFKVLLNECANVSWDEESSDESENGKEFGVYVFDVSKEDYKLDNEDLGIGVYSVLDVFWFKTEKKRKEFLKFSL